MHSHVYVEKWGVTVKGLIGINEGIEELTLTLLIGIKADLLQFILYPDKLLK